MELRAKDLDTIKALLQQGDYLNLIGFLLKEPMTEYPPAEEIETAVASLQNYKFQLLLRIQAGSESYDGGGGRRLFLLWPALWASRNPEGANGLVGYDDHWSPHPDGIGFLCAWTPNYPPVIILSADGDIASLEVNPIEASFIDQIDKWKQKIELGNR